MIHTHSSLFFFLFCFFYKMKRFSSNLISFQVTALILDSPILIWRDLSPAALILCVLEVKGSF